jgi:hypothetical protein
MNRAVQAELVEVMQQHPQFSVQALNAILISRNLERAADHATNIAEDVIFWLRGSDVRHKLSLARSGLIPLRLGLEDHTECELNAHHIRLTATHDAIKLKQ